jgi:hypothetical protein
MDQWLVLPLQFSTRPSKLFKFPEIVSRQPSLGGYGPEERRCPAQMLALHVLWSPLFSAVTEGESLHS